MDILGTEARESFLEGHAGWTIDGETLSKTFTHGSFAAAIGFVASVGVLAEKAFHHPDIDVRYSKVSITLTTHDAGGLTANDTDLADQIENL